MTRVNIAYQLHGNNIKHITLLAVYSVNIVDGLMFLTTTCLSKKVTTITMDVDIYVFITSFQLSEFFLNLHTVLLISKIFSAAWLGIIF